MLPVLKFNPYFKSVIWGGSRIARFKGIPSQGDDIGESWELSPMPGHESVVSDGEFKGMTLNELVARYPAEILGKKVDAKWHGNFPLLVKFIDSNDDLSIQVHPDDALARERHNSLGKTEMWYSILPSEGAYLYAGFNREMTPDKFRAMIADNTIVSALGKFFVLLLVSVRGLLHVGFCVLADQAVPRQQFICISKVCGQSFQKFLVIAGNVQIVQLCDNVVKSLDVVNTQGKDTVICQHQLFLLGLRQPGRDVAIRFLTAHRAQSVIQAISRQNRTHLVNHDRPDLPKHFNGPLKLGDLLIRMNTDIFLRPFQIRKALFDDLHTAAAFLRSTACQIKTATIAPATI